MREVKSGDMDKLRMLSIFYYVYGGILALMSLFPVIHIVVGASFLFGVINTPPGDPAFPAHFFGGMFLGVGTLVMMFMMAQAALMLYAGRCLGQVRNRTFCLVAGGVACFFMPIGTVLGILSLVFLSQDSVRDLFASREGLADL